MTVIDDGGSGDTEKPVAPNITVTISRTSLDLEVGATFALSASASDGSSVKWNSANNAVATVSNGTVTARAEGSTSIFATCGTAFALCTVTVKASSVQQPDVPQITPPTGYALVWHDEFDGSSLDMTKWSYQVGRQDNYNGVTGPDKWGNNELQYYTEGNNVTVSDGSLKITAKKENYNGAEYTSSRIVTRDKAFWTYGYIEARMKTPTGDGMWPAFWMLPQPNGSYGMDNAYGGWASSGEIDIMEAKGRLMNKADTTLHFGNAGMSTYRTNVTTLNSNTDEWHTYAVEWTAEYIAWIIDGNEAMRVLPRSYEYNGWWSQIGQEQGNDLAPFDKDFYILLNLAVGGQYDNYAVPDDGFTSASMEVDYVRVFQKTR